MDHCRSGPGTLFVGNVKSVYDPRSGGSVLRSNRVYEGNWQASELRPGSTVSGPSLIGASRREGDCLFG